MRRFIPFLLRDLVITAVTAFVMVLDARAWTGFAGTALGMATGALVTLVAFAAHEWGHLTGALGSGGIVEAPRSIASVFLFEFDEKASTREQFLAMSVGGYLASIVAVMAISLWIDLGRVSGITTAVLAGSGIALTFALEMPKTWKVFRQQ